MRLFFFLFFISTPIFSFHSSWENGYTIPREDVLGRKWTDYIPHAPPMSLESDLKTLKKNQIVEVTLKVKDLKSFFGAKARFHYDDKSSDDREITQYSDQKMNMIQENEWIKISFAPKHEKGKRLIKFSLYFDFKKDFSKDFKISLRPVEFKQKIKNQGIVSLTFDDGTKDHLNIAKLLNRHNLKGTFYVITDYHIKPNFLSIDEINKMSELNMEIAHHHYNPITEMYYPNLNKNLRDNYNKYKNKIKNLTPHFSYPQGRFDLSGYYEYVKNHYKSARIVGGGLETLPPGDEHLLRSINITSKTSADDLISITKEALVTQSWAILMFHIIKDDNSKGLVEFSLSEFKKYIEYLKKENISVKTIDEVISTLK